MGGRQYRRQFLRTATTAGVATLTGCGGMPWSDGSRSPQYPPLTRAWFYVPSTEEIQFALTSKRTVDATTIPSGKEVLDVDGDVVLDDDSGTVPWFEPSTAPADGTVPEAADLPDKLLCDPEATDLQQVQENLPDRGSDEVDLGATKDGGLAPPDRTVTGRIGGAISAARDGRGPQLRVPSIEYAGPVDLEPGAVQVKFRDGFVYTFPQAGTEYDDATAGRYDTMLERTGLNKAGFVSDSELTPALTHRPHPCLATVAAVAERRAHGLKSAHGWFDGESTRAVQDRWKSWTSDQLEFAFKTIFFVSIGGTAVPLTQMVSIASLWGAASNYVTASTAEATIVAADGVAAAKNFYDAVNKIENIEEAFGGELTEDEEIAQGSWVNHLVRDENAPEGSLQHPQSISYDIIGPTLLSLGSLGSYEVEYAVPSIATAPDQSGVDAAASELRALLDKQSKGLRKLIQGARRGQDSTADVALPLEDYLHCMRRNVEVERALLDRIEADLRAAGDATPTATPTPSPTQASTTTPTSTETTEATPIGTPEFSPGIVDDFEGENTLNPYTIHFWYDVAVVTGVSRSGDRSLRLGAGPEEDDFSFLHSAVGDGLPRYPVPGTMLETWIRTDAARGAFFIYFGGPEYGRGYRLSLEFSDGAVQLRQQDDPSEVGTVLAETALDFAPDTWYRVRIDWGRDGRIAASLSDDAGDASANLTATSTDYSEGLVGYGFGGNVGGGGTAWVDAVRLI